MIVLMRCVAEAVVANGVKGLAVLVPGGAFLYEVATDSLRRFREERRAAALREEVLSVATATFGRRGRRRRPFPPRSARACRPRTRPRWRCT
jgi:hypothetical protein